MNLIPHIQTLLDLLTQSQADPVLLYNWRLIRTVVTNGVLKDEGKPDQLIQFVRAYFELVRDFKEEAEDGDLRGLNLVERYGITPHNYGEKFEQAKAIYERVKQICLPNAGVAKQSLFT